MECKHKFNLVVEEENYRNEYIFQCRKCHRLIRVYQYDNGEIEVNTYKED